jgi:hypothetical protein
MSPGNANDLCRQHRPRAVDADPDNAEPMPPMATAYKAQIEARSHRSAMLCEAMPAEPALAGDKRRPRSPTLPAISA